jgi:transcriptional regulator with XRE-family HTH domain
MKANLLLKQNIKALLRGRGQTQRDLAQWCRRSETWISHIFTSDTRGVPLKYLDRIADFFGIATYQLLQPGITPLTERRAHTRRTGADRRVADVTHLLRDHEPAGADRSLITEVLRLDRADRTILLAQLAELKRQRTGASSTERSPAAPRSTSPKGRRARRRPDPPIADASAK